MNLPPIGSAMQFHPTGGAAVYAATVVAHNDTGDGFMLLLHMLDGRTATVDTPRIQAEGETCDRPYCCPVPAFERPRIIVLQ